MLLHRHRIIRAALDRQVVADDHALPALDAPDAGDDAGGVNLVLVHAIGGERRKFEKRRPRIEQPVHPLARQKLAPRGVAVARFLAAAKRRGRAARSKVFTQRAPLGRRCLPIPSIACRLLSASFAARPARFAVSPPHYGAATAAK